MNKAKRVIQRNLPITQTYTVLGSSYVGIENGCTCDNCGRLIANVAEVKGLNDGRTYSIGMDCAETLSGIKDNFDFEYIHKANFQQAKGARKYILNANKRAKEKGLKLTVTVRVYGPDAKGFYKQGGIMINLDSDKPYLLAGWKQYPLDLGEKYIFPMIKDLAVIPELETAN